MMGSGISKNPTFLFQFTDDNAWTCNDHTCLDRCSFDDIIFEGMDDLKVNTETHYADNAEAVCEMAYTVMKNHKEFETFECKHEAYNMIAILISNSNLHHHVLHPLKGSPCKVCEKRPKKD